MDPRAGLDGRKISSPPGCNPGPSSPLSVAIPTELPGPHLIAKVSENHQKTPKATEPTSHHDCHYGSAQ